MKNQRLVTFGLLVCVACLFAISGCNKSAEQGGEILDESWFASADQEEESADAPADTTESTARLGVQLKEGARFPLQKVVEKTLTQSTLQGPVESRERIELFMSVTVDEIRDQNKKFSVRYNRVRYQSEFNGRQVVYDSRQPPYPIPDAALAYHGMVNNGFSFWVGADNRISDVVDFHEFLQRCLSAVPAQKADLVAETLAQYSGQEGIANFVDDTIGLLPFDPNSKDGTTIVRLGGSWTKSRHFSNPVPMLLNVKYTMKELNDSVAEIEIEGDISPSAAVSSTDKKPVALQVQDGFSMGDCTIDRKTGLPIRSRIDHVINMAVQVNGRQFKQQKRVVTSIRMFPDQEMDSPAQSTAQRTPRKSDLVLRPASQQKQK